jgi:hypothetical protein
MNSQTTILKNLLRYSVRLNNLLIPVRDVASALARFTLSLVAANDNHAFPISLVGSCVAIKYKEHYLALCTRHQLKNWDLERIALLTDDGKHAITSGGVRHFNEINETEFNDLVAFNFIIPCCEQPFLQERFFDFRELPPDATSDQIVCLIASGYPFYDQDFDFENGRRRLVGSFNQFERI